jgi:hypothetical protein
MPVVFDTCLSKLSTFDQTAISLYRHDGVAGVRQRQRVGAIGEENPMLWTIAVILMVLWLLGLVSSYTMGGFIHILLVIAIITVLVRIIQGRRVL